MTEKAIVRLVEHVVYEVEVDWNGSLDDVFTKTKDKLIANKNIHRTTTELGFLDVVVVGGKENA